MKTEKGKMTVAEAGRRGGRTTSKRYGKEFFQFIGQQGGKTTSKNHGTEFYKKIGSKGGQRVKELIEAGKEND